VAPVSMSADRTSSEQAIVCVQTSPLHMQHIRRDQLSCTQHYILSCVRCSLLGCPSRCLRADLQASELVTVRLDLQGGYEQSRFTDVTSRAPTLSRLLLVFP
jgi:hypothetical protein